MTRYYFHRDHAIQHEIIDAIEATGVAEAGAYDIDAIADKTIGRAEAGFYLDPDVDFWAIVAEHEL